MVGFNALYGYDKSGKMIRDCPQVKNQAKADTLPRPNPTGAADPPKRKEFYALKGREDQEKSADMVMGKLLAFSFLAYALLDQESTLSFFTLLVASKSDLLHEILFENFLICTPIGYEH